MYKKIILSLLAVIMIFFSSCSAPLNNGTAEKNENADKEYVRAVWITYYELSSLTKDNDESHFKKAVNKMFKELENNGFNRVTVQVRPNADAFYKSAYFPVSSHCFGKQGSELLYDPLEIMVELAHKHDLSIEAWVNPYRVCQTPDFSALSENNIALKWKDTENLIVCDSGIYFNPASAEVTELIVNGVKEIVQNYDVDSVCFDDYFYPVKTENIDKQSYSDYTKNGGKLSLDDWRRENVSNMVKSVYSAVKEMKPSVTFGISPASNIENDYASLYADVRKWACEDGYVDYLCPQIYFGFQNENQPFMKTVKEWIRTAQCDLYVALPMYKTGLEDEYAGESGINEFAENNNIISRQVIYLSKLDEISGFYIFSYSSLKDDDETKNLYSAMQNDSE